MSDIKRALLAFSLRILRSVLVFLQDNIDCFGAGRLNLTGQVSQHCGRHQGQKCAGQIHPTN
jgi:hypothetical protein